MSKEKLLFDKPANRIRYVWVYDSKSDAEKDADVMNACASMFFYSPVKGDFYWHVGCFDSETKELLNYL